jgi:hypothetical protein
MLVAFVLFIFVVYLAYSGSIVLPDYWTQLAVALTATALAILYWGFKPRIDGFLKERKGTQRGEAEKKVLSTEIKKQGSPLLPDITKITRLNIDDRLLDQIYEEVHRRAINIYHDAQLSYFTIQVFPFQLSGTSVNIYLNFYSKWADKICKFAYHDPSGQLDHMPPDKRPTFDSFKRSFTTLPWKESPQWMEFLNRVYAKIGPLSSASGTFYHLSAEPNQKIRWTVSFEDGFSGNEYSFRWNGKGLDENSIEQFR